MHIRNMTAAAGAAVMLAAGLGATTAAATAAPASASKAPVLTSIRAAHHPGFDLLVFQFRGRVPAHRSAAYVKQVREDGRGNIVRIKGKAKLLVRFYFANGYVHRHTYNLPGVIQVVQVGDFEAVLTFGVGVSRHAPFHMSTLTNPSRVVINIKTRA